MIFRLKLSQILLPTPCKTLDFNFLIPHSQIFVNETIEAAMLYSERSRQPYRYLINFYWQWRSKWRGGIHPWEHQYTLQDIKIVFLSRILYQYA